MKYHVIGAALLGGLLSVGSANAATCTINGNQSTTYTVEVSGASVCSTGNDTNTITTSSNFFNMTGWTLADKNDDVTSGNQNLTFATAPVNGAVSGTWSISNPDNYTSVFMTLKAGNSFAAFLLDAATFMSGTWSSTRDLSHASIYYRGQPAPIPLPASGVLLLAGLAGLAVARRRKSTSA